MEEVDAFIDLLKKLRERCKNIIVPSWQVPLNQIVFATSQFKHEVGVDRSLLIMNLQLAKAFDGLDGFHLLNALRN